MECANEPQLQLLLISKDVARIEQLTAMLYADGIQTVSEPASHLGVQPDWSFSSWSQRKTIQKL